MLHFSYLHIYKYIYCMLTMRQKRMINRCSATLKAPATALCLSSYGHGYASASYWINHTQIYAYGSAYTRRLDKQTWNLTSQQINPTVIISSVETNGCNLYLKTLTSPVSLEMFVDRYSSVSVCICSHCSSNFAVVTNEGYENKTDVKNTDTC